jgi:putative transposase
METQRPSNRGHQRCRRIDYADSENAFLLTLCVGPRRPAFSSETVNTNIVKTLREVQSQGFWGVYVYCIMPDHLHLVVNPGGRGIPESVRRFKGRMTAWWRRYGDGLHLWQDGYFDHLIRGSESFSGKCGYVLQNPVRAGLVAAAEEYRWSGSLAAR